MPGFLQEKSVGMPVSIGYIMHVFMLFPPFLFATGFPLLSIQVYVAFLTNSMLKLVKFLKTLLEYIMTCLKDDKRAIIWILSIFKNRRFYHGFQKLKDSSNTLLNL